jgi:hypothetical protein
LCKHAFLLLILVVAVANKLFFLGFELPRLAADKVIGSQNFAAEPARGTAGAISPALCLAKTHRRYAGAETFEG